MVRNGKIFCSLWQYHLRYRYRYLTNLYIVFATVKYLKLGSSNKFLTIPVISCFIDIRTQDLPGGSGQCGEDDYSVPVPDERGGSHVPHHRQQRGGGRLEQYTLHHVGPGGTGVAQDLLEYLLLQYRGRPKLYRYLTYRIHLYIYLPALDIWNLLIQKPKPAVPNLPSG